MLSESVDFSQSSFKRPDFSDNFKHRRDVKKIIRYLPSVVNRGVPEHFFITGKRGAGKTSFINHVSKIAEDKFNMIPIHFNNSGSSVENLISSLFDKLIKEFDISFDDGFLKRIGGNGFSLDKKEKLIEDIKINFSDFLIELCEKLPENKGLFIVIDEINGLSNNLEFTHWYKGLFEAIVFNEDYVPVVFVLVSCPDEFYNLSLINESFSRIFHLIEMDS